MNVLLLYFLTSVIFGILALFLSGLTLSITKEQSISWRILSLTGFLLLVSCNLIVIFGEMTGQSELNSLALLIPDAGIVLLILSQGPMVNEMAMAPFRSQVNRAFFILAAIAAALSISHVFYQDRGGNFLFLPIAGILVVSIIYTSLISLIYHSESSILIGAFGLILLSGFVLVDIFGMFKLSETKVRILTTPFFYILFCIVFIHRDTGILKSIFQRGGDYTGYRDFLSDERLSPREKDVIKLLINGSSYSEIANTLCISHATVKTHVKNIYQKLGVSGKMGLVQKILHK